MRRPRCCGLCNCVGCRRVSLWPISNTSGAGTGTSAAIPENRVVTSFPQTGEQVPLLPAPPQIPPLISHRLPVTWSTTVPSCARTVRRLSPPHPRPHLPPPLRRARLPHPRCLQRPQPRPQQPQRRDPILQLRPRRLAPHLHPRRPVRQQHRLSTRSCCASARRGRCRSTSTTSRSRSATCTSHRRRLGEHGHGDGAGVDAVSLLVGAGSPRCQRWPPASSRNRLGARPSTVAHAQDAEAPAAPRGTSRSKTVVERAARVDVQLLVDQRLGVLAPFGVRGSRWHRWGVPWMDPSLAGEIAKWRASIRPRRAQPGSTNPE